MEVGHNIISVMQVIVEAAIGQNNTRHTSNGEHEDEAHRPNHGCLEAHRTAPHCCNPAEDLYTCWYRDHHRCRRKVHFHVNAHARGEHVVRPDNKADDANCNHGIGHAEIAKHWLAAEGCYDLADDAETWQNHDVHFRVTEEPEQMLIQDRVTASRRIKECAAKVTVDQKHRNCSRQHWQSEQQQECSDQHRPHEQRHFVQGHARRAHVENGGDEVNGTQNRRGTSKVKRENGHVYGRTDRARG